MDEVIIAITALAGISTIGAAVFMSSGKYPDVNGPSTTPSNTQPSIPDDECAKQVKAVRNAVNNVTRFTDDAQIQAILKQILDLRKACPGSDKFVADEARLRKILASHGIAPPPVAEEDEDPCLGAREQIEGIDARVSSMTVATSKEDLTNTLAEIQDLCKTCPKEVAGKLDAAEAKLKELLNPEPPVDCSKTPEHITSINDRVTRMTAATSKEEFTNTLTEIDDLRKTCPKEVAGKLNASEAKLNELLNPEPDMEPAVDCSETPAHIKSINDRVTAMTAATSKDDITKTLAEIEELRKTCPAEVADKLDADETRLNELLNPAPEVKPPGDCATHLNSIQEQVDSLESPTKVAVQALLDEVEVLKVKCPELKDDLDLQEETLKGMLSTAI